MRMNADFLRTGVILSAARRWPSDIAESKDAIHVGTAPSSERHFHTARRENFLLRIARLRISGAFDLVELPASEQSHSAQDGG